MPRGAMLVYSSPVSKEREAEYNDWYNNVHAPEVCALAGIAGVSRYRVSEKQMFRNYKPPVHSYLAVYELDDIEVAIASLRASTKSLSSSDAVLQSVVADFFEPIFTYKK